jgi:hypothetical protein
VTGVAGVTGGAVTVADAVGVVGVVAVTGGGVMP